jgi:amino acid transporter
MMTERETRNKPPRLYPPIYERLIPIALILILIGIIGLLILIFLIATGTLGFSG